VLSFTGRIVLLLAILLSVGFFVNEVWARIRLVLLGRKDEKRWDRPLERLGFVFAKVGSQLCSIKDRPFVGVMHALVFYGFVLFTVATINHVAGAFSKGFSFLGHGRFNDLWFLGVDLIAALTIIGTVVLAVRRFILKPQAITQPMPISRSPQSAIVLSLIFGLMLTYLANQGAEIALSGHSFAAWMPISKAGAAKLAGIPPNALIFWNQIFWWSHILMVLAFLVFIPHSKHLHLLAGPINIFFRSRKSIGTLEKIDFEASEQYGATLATQFQWKSLMDAFSCVDCGRCQDECPAFRSDKPLSPKVVMMSLRKHLLNERANLLGGKEPSEPVMDKWQTPDEIWACTTCGACMEACPVLNEHIPAIVELRRAQVMMDSRFPQELAATFRGLETNSNPWNMGHDGRANWAEGLNVPLMAENPEVDYLWFVGCAGSFDDRGKSVSQALAKILNQAGVSYGILGLEEKCCGDAARRAGNEYLFQMMAEENVQTLKQYRFKKILTSCPHGYNVIKNEYGQFGGEFEVVHHSQLIAGLLQEGRIKLTANGDGKMTFHDSCYLGRYNDVYDAPRSVVKALGNGGYIEMPQSKNKSFCCGAGGARMFMEENIGRRINHLRVEEAKQSGADTLAVACPFCLTMMDDGIKEKGWEGEMKALDIAQAVAKSMA
jgi:Fe-S oxidoreductase